MFLKRGFVPFEPLEAKRKISKVRHECPEGGRVGIDNIE